METVFSQKQEIIKNWRWWKQYRSWDRLSWGSMMNAKVSLALHRKAFVWTLCHLFLVCVGVGKSKPYEWAMKWDERKRILSCILWKVFLRCFQGGQTNICQLLLLDLLVQDIQINLLNTRWDEKEKRWKNINFHSDDGFCTKGDEKARDVS